VKGGVEEVLSLMEEMATTWQISLCVKTEASALEARVGKSVERTKNEGERGKGKRTTHVLRVVIRLPIVHSLEFGSGGGVTEADKNE
jgi:hypothetical protein